MDKVGFLGAYGTFSEIAVIRFFEGKTYEACSFTDFTSLIAAVETKQIDYALLPVENTTTGMIYRTYDLLKDSHISVIGEVHVRIDEHLITLPGVKIEEIREVYTHPEPIAQCQGFFQAHPWIKAIPYQDTSKSVEYIKSCKDPSKAALASYLAAKHFELPILMEKVQDNQDNITRFFCVSNDQSALTEGNKISLYFVVDHKPGTLYKVIEVFAQAGINMVKLESRPLQGHIFEYCFYIDFDGNIQDLTTQNALVAVKQHCLEMKVLGCYQRATKEDLQ